MLYKAADGGRGRASRRRLRAGRRRKRAGRPAGLEVRFWGGEACLIESNYLFFTLVF